MTSFNFGKNWQAFLSTVDDRRIREAEDALAGMIGRNLAGRNFLDVGSGSGLMSLAARRLGARVHSFDYNSESVSCSKTLQDRFFPGDPDWRLEQGDVLDAAYLKTLQHYDIVYGWGVLHHTGDMWRAMENITSLVTEGGTLFIAIYNDQGWRSRAWRATKRLYNRSPDIVRKVMEIGALLLLWGPRVILDTVRYANPLHSWREYYRHRGMSAWHDVVDWIGGYPFEFSKPEKVFDFYRERGYTLERLSTCAGGHGCNQFVFRRKGAVKSA